jgi:hypothetical protein
MDDLLDQDFFAGYSANINLRVANGFIGAAPEHEILKSYIDKISTLTKIEPPWDTVGGTCLKLVLEESNAMDKVLPSYCFYTEDKKGNPINQQGKNYSSHYWGTRYKNEKSSNKISQSMTIKGTVQSGQGESSQWMPDYIPWLIPGTLNIRLYEKRPPIEYFESINTHYGKPCKIAKCKINNVEAFIILAPLGKEHKGKVEIGAKFNIRERFNLFDGDEVIINF